jgi:selenide,water dikinase
LFPAARFPELLVGLRPSDDAAVYRIADDLALVATLDFITPVVDDPYAYGAVAAANSLSDVYAMGGRVALALNVCCFPACLGQKVIGEILRGGADKVVEAGGVLAGGHTVDNDQPLYGLVAIGLVNPRRVLSKTGARPGDALVLTKPLGVGMITTASKADQARREHVAEALQSMQRLNRFAAECLVAADAHACTDVTGFSLLGHACEIAERSQVSLRFELSRLPLLPGAAEYADQWLFPAGTAHNRDAYSQRVRFAEGIAEEIQLLLYTPETSGGLLAAVAPGALGVLEQMFRRADASLWLVGEVAESESGVLVSVSP